jgi:hypothetical protein
MVTSQRCIDLRVRLQPTDARRVVAAAAEMDMTPSAWVKALVRRRLSRCPTFGRADFLVLTAVQGDLRRIGLTVKQIARSLDAASVEGGAPSVNPSVLKDLQQEIRHQMMALVEAFNGNLSYWEVEE